MGLKTIEEMRKSAERRKTSYWEFRKAAEKLIDGRKEIVEMRRKLKEATDKLRNKGLSDLGQLRTYNEPEFVEFKKKLTKAYEDWSLPAPETKDLYDAVERKEKIMNDEVEARLKKMEARFPDKIEKGMVFKMNKNGTYWEVKEMKGDKIIISSEKNPGYGADLKELQKEFKFVKD